MRRALIPLLLVAATAFAAGCGEKDEPAADAAATIEGAVSPAESVPVEAVTERLADGTAELDLDDGFESSLGEAGIELDPIAPATFEGGVLSLPVTGGFVNPDDGGGYIEHAGGLRLTAGDRTAHLSDFFVDTRTGTIYPRLGGARVAMFRIDRGATAVERDGDAIVAEAFDVTLTEDGASALTDSLEKEFDAGAAVATLGLRLETGMADDARAAADRLERELEELAAEAENALDPGERERLQEAVDRLEDLVAG